MSWLTKIVPSRKDYLAQPNDYTCQSTCIAMVTGGDILSIRSALETLGEPGDPSVMGAYLRPRVKEYKFLLDASLNDAKKAIDEGWQLITHGWFSRSGHVVKLSGYEADPKTLSYRFVVDDPYGEFDFKDWQYTSNQDGNDQRYSSYGIYAACVASSGYSDAARVYRQGQLDSAKGNMWLHMIKT